MGSIIINSHVPTETLRRIAGGHYEGRTGFDSVLPLGLLDHSETLLKHYELSRSAEENNRGDPELTRKVVLSQKIIPKGLGFVIGSSIEDDMRLANIFVWGGTPTDACHVPYQRIVCYERNIADRHGLKVVENLKLEDGAFCTDEAAIISWESGLWDKFLRGDGSADSAKEYLDNFYSGTADWNQVRFE
ncbi:hypothetical protein COU61_00525 [Candidatus Pacearchaeota archaeon CG10_big_fil_rev_8_21_14_0_10_35_13]|nr:MAG: hypothetical protein COU61_00525 [Candidatus Pacearchaeota archaeon CG10_big_fil_rev_8_21_14_0_10_35_13]